MTTARGDERSAIAVPSGWLWVISSTRMATLARVSGLGRWKRYRWRPVERARVGPVAVRRPRVTRRLVNQVRAKLEVHAFGRVVADVDDEPLGERSRLDIVGHVRPAHRGELQIRDVIGKLLEGGAGVPKSPASSIRWSTSTALYARRRKRGPGRAAYVRPRCPPQCVVGRASG